MATLCIAPFSLGGWVWPHDPFVWSLFIGIGVAALVGHLLVTTAHRFAAASVLAPFGCLHIIFGADRWLASRASAIYTGKLTRAPRRRRDTPSATASRCSISISTRSIGCCPDDSAPRSLRLVVVPPARLLRSIEVPLKRAVLDLVEARLGVRPSGPVRLLTQVRCFGYVLQSGHLLLLFRR